MSGRRRTLPLAGWAALLGTLVVTAVTAGTALVLGQEGELHRGALGALAVGLGAGLGGAGVGVLAAAQVGAGLRGLHRDAVRRLHDPGTSRPSGALREGTPAGTELAELAHVLEALHRRVRVADELGERHRRDAEDAAAGVFELLSGLVRAEEAARGQLAAELHDTVAQSLMLARGLLRGEQLAETDLDRLREYVEDAEEQVRAVMARTRPPALRDGDLAQAVHRLAQDMDARYGLCVALSWPDSAVALPLASATTLYRFFQEALLNVVKHCDVDAAVATLRLEPELLVAEVRDAGPGFDPAAVQPVQGRHVGLGLLRERARLSGGRLEVSSALGRGTVLSLRLPLPAAAPAFVPAQRDPSAALVAG